MKKWFEIIWKSSKGINYRGLRYINWSGFTVPTKKWLKVLWRNSIWRVIKSILEKFSSRRLESPCGSIWRSDLKYFELFKLKNWLEVIWKSSKNINCGGLRYINRIEFSVLTKKWLKVLRRNSIWRTDWKWFKGVQKTLSEKNWDISIDLDLLCQQKSD